ncbi:tRNA pseudouridine(55) synthase TruB [Desulfobacter hydrogenophilus]|uniref:tRNA pseudouridine synthase B n=1 Tax=Desulfobacter hydrogenophilus TaxID=2291 RepID=A0A328FGA4_9BACT|nr:tRNA pseudouridine(55) synthase TruB [Desulfobacter hydrogenophilus]NDY71976.1 tRNA pseudouridine(55) synthase TruB [Desulfobacter hydrogenophilus]QBH12332.1 tRNA pseudouridine(55) synthase TruB [Desulfobacter hydrogenophilus]RAM02067.1 tRNA pseudouridine(55) synthase TruB [Desulfobacter hydrogenophilus]
MKNGILVVNKPKGISSAGVVSRLKRLLKVKKIGHTGTLDPFATGVLPIAVGQATRISKYFLKGVKGYYAQVTLGIETDTYDCTGTVTHTAPSDHLSALGLDQVKDVVTGFLGHQEQIPPAYSALKHKGQPLYKLARQGQIIEKPPRPIEIMSITMENFRMDTNNHPVFDMPVTCSGGTYIRSLAHDIGLALGCGAHLSALQRTRAGQFKIEHAEDLDCFEKMSSFDREARFISMSQCLDFLPAIVADNEIAGKVKHGQPLSVAEIPMPDDLLIAGDKNEVQNIISDIRVLDSDDTLLAIVTPDKSGQTYKYCCVFNA